MNPIWLGMVKSLKIHEKSGFEWFAGNYVVFG